jgi:hypothetical protein
MRGLGPHGYVQDVPQGVPDLVAESTEPPLPVAAKPLPAELSRPTNDPSGVGMALSCEFPPCVAAAVVVNSSRNPRPAILTTLLNAGYQP